MYGLLTYIISLITTDVHVLLFAIEFIICLFIFLTAYMNRKRIHMAFFYLCFLLLFYNITLNLSRQGLALAVLLYAISCFEDKQKIKGGIFFVISCLFHTTTLFAIPIILFIFLNDAKISKKLKNILFLIIICILMLCVIFYEEIMYFLTFSLKIFPDKYYNYFDSEFVYETLNFNKIDIIFQLITLGIYYFYKRITKLDDLNLYGKMMIVSILLIPISAQISNASRVALYYEIPGMMYILPQFNKLFKDRDRQLINYFLTILLFFYWIYVFAIEGVGETIPYISPYF